MLRIASVARRLLPPLLPAHRPLRPLSLSLSLSLFFSSTSHAAFAPDKLSAIDTAVGAAIAAHEIPGAVVWIEHGEDHYTKAYGDRAVSPVREPATLDTIYDAASLTKPIATTTAILQLVEQGRLALDAPVARYWPEFGAHGKDAVTVRQLLTHMSGLRPDLSLRDAWSGTDTALSLTTEERLQHPPGTRFVYSDINFIVLGELVRRASGQPLAAYVAEHVCQPLGLRDTGFLPPAAQRPRIAPTQLTAGVMLRGVVHDPTARRMDGVAGHAGLFTTAADLARFCRMLLGGGALEGVRILKPETVAALSLGQPEAQGLRGLGWDVNSPYASVRGRWFPAGRSYGHTGWTGTSVWIDPVSRTFVIVLTNRVHPDGKGNVIPLRQTISTLAAEAIGLDASAVRNGIDVLERDNFAALRGLRVGLITNQSGRDRAGRSTIDLLHTAPGVRLVALFSPEHGIRGEADATVQDARDQKTGLPIYSLYGPSPARAPGTSDAEHDLAVIRARAPRAEQLESVDALVFDIQDIGARFYTYASTLGASLEAAARAHKKFFVLDRVNPINGRDVEGPVLTLPPSFIGFHSVPVRHGMTVGELARLFNAERGCPADLIVVPCEHWRRSTWFDDTGLAWVNPSPSMRSLAAATLYPGLCLLERTALSMGRGTATPFEQVGAPYIDGAALARELTDQALPGVRFEPVRFTPSMAFYPGPESTLKYRGQECGGVRVILTDRNQAAVVDVGVVLALTLQRLYPEHFDVAPMARFVGDPAILALIRADRPLPEIKAAWVRGLDAFRSRRQTHLLYRD
ncbi:serine hydrolase [Opitutus sp. ER46]|uniref:serine hydrolase n=1 Tax=Opitutus sp. ER46 TaxID=2161864 RepID=UPI000D322E40|nr:serine hydrolase [Opitutus sp. ER46]PTX91309.1 hypothetical protein DB354_20730 [Opitutus sp. ER46]